MLQIAQTSVNVFEDTHLGRGLMDALKEIGNSSLKFVYQCNDSHAVNAIISELSYVIWLHFFFSNEFHLLAYNSKKSYFIICYE